MKEIPIGAIVRLVSIPPGDEMQLAYGPYLNRLAKHVEINKFKLLEKYGSRSRHYFCKYYYLLATEEFLDLVHS